MTEPVRRSWIATALFWVTLALSGCLILLVILAPLLHDPRRGDFWARLLTAFAEDVVLQRTALASALGLLVTAFVFFPPRILP